MTLGPRWGRNPKTGHSVTLPKTTNPTFRADKKLTARLNKAFRLLFESKGNANPVVALAAGRE